MQRLLCKEIFVFYGARMTAPDASVVRTERLVVLDMYSRPDVVRFLGSSPTPMASLERRAGHRARPRAQRRGAGAGTVAVVAIADDPDGTLEVAWHLHPDSQGHGYATEAARAVLTGLMPGVPEVLVLVAPANTASLAVARRLGLGPAG